MGISWGVILPTSWGVKEIYPVQIPQHLGPPIHEQIMCPSSPNPVDPGIRGTLRAPSIQNGGLINKNIGILEGF